MKRSWLKTVQAVLALLLAFTTVPAVPVQAEDGNADFEKFMNSEFAAAMGKDLMTMHFTVRDYAKYGITKPEAKAGTATMQDYQDNIDTAQASLDALAKFDYNSLSTEQQYDYDVYKNSLNDTIALNSYPMFDFWFNPGEGLTANLLTNFTEYIFYEQQDIDDYLDMIDTSRHLVLCAPHPSPLSASYGFFGCRHFSKANAFLKEKGIAPVDWQIPNIHAVHRR